jgi:hypothetical protein
VSVTGIEPGTSWLELRLTGGREVELAVRGEHAEPLDVFAFTILDASGEEVLQRGRTEDGLASFRLPGEEFLVSVAARYHTRTMLGPLAPHTTPELLEVRLEPVPGVRGSVLANGDCVAGAKVRLHRVVAKDVRYLHAGERCWLEPMALAEEVSGEDGGFVLTARTPGHYVVQVDRPGYATAEHGPFRVGTDLSCEPFEVHLGAGGAIEGRVTLATGADPTGTLVFAHRGDGRGRTQRVGRDGVFRLETLTPGPWTVEVRGDEPDHRSHSTPPSLLDYDEDVARNCEVIAGRTTYHDIDVPDPRAFVFEGRIEIEGLANAAMTVFLCPRNHNFYNGPGSYESTTPDRDGYFELAAARAGEHRLVVRTSAEGQEYVVLDEVEVDDGLEPWELELETGSVAIEDIDPALFAADMPPFLFAHRKGDFAFLAMGAPSGGTATVGVAPVGTGHLVRPAMEHALDPTKWESIAEFEVERGETTRVPSP